MTANETRENGSGGPEWVEVALRQQVGELEVEGRVRACASDLYVKIERPWPLRLASSHIPYFALSRKRWAEDGSLTPDGECEVAALVAAGVELVQRAIAKRGEVVAVHTGWRWETAPIALEAAAASRHLDTIRREGRQRIRDGTLSNKEFQEQWMRPAKERLAQAKLALREAEHQLDARLAALLGFAEGLPAGVNGEALLALLERS